MAAAPTGWSRPGFVTRPTPPAVNRNGARCAGQQCDRGNDRQTRRGVDVVAAVLDDGARGPVCRQAAELRCDLHDDAPWACADQRFPARGRSAAAPPRAAAPAPHRCRWCSRSAVNAARCGCSAQIGASALRRSPANSTAYWSVVSQTAHRYCPVQRRPAVPAQRTRLTAQRRLRRRPAFGPAPAHAASQ